MAEATPTPTPFEKMQHILGQCRESRKLVLLIVAIGLLLDNMLLTSGLFLRICLFFIIITRFILCLVVPIIPAFLFELHHSKDMIALNESYQTSTPTPAQEWNRRIEQNLEDSQILAQIKWASTNNKLPFLNPQCEKAVCVK